MEKLRASSVGLAVTTYESENPILTHIFWAETIQDAFSVAKSHLKTDFFFSSSFVGTMKWKNSELILSNDIQTIGISRYSKKLLNELEDEAYELNEHQTELEIDELVNML